MVSGFKYLLQRIALAPISLAVAAWFVFQYSDEVQVRAQNTTMQLEVLKDSSRILASSHKDFGNLRGVVLARANRRRLDAPGLRPSLKDLGAALTVVQLDSVRIDNSFAGVQELTLERPILSLCTALGAEAAMWRRCRSGCLPADVERNDFLRDADSISWVSYSKANAEAIGMLSRKSAIANDALAKATFYSRGAFWVSFGLFALSLLIIFFPMFTASPTAATAGGMKVEIIDDDATPADLISPLQPAPVRPDHATVKTLAND